MLNNLYIEQRLKLNDDLWGTADAVWFKPRRMDVGDLKTGAGVKVSAVENGQLLTYAVLARHEWGPIYGPFDTIGLHIIQPALGHIDLWECSSDYLDLFEADLIATVERIRGGDNRAVPGEKQCRFCRGKAVCRARAEHNVSLLRQDFAPPATLSLDEIATYLPHCKQIVDWCNALEDHAFKEAEKGETVPGYKLVSGRSNRVWRSEDEAAAALSVSGVPEDKLWKKKLIGLTEAEKLLGKSHPVFVEQTVKPPGKPALVPEKDPRPALESLASDFTSTTF